MTANIIGEKNLEFEVESNYSEVGRILGLLGIDVNIRHVRNCSTRDLYSTGNAALNLLRDQSVRAVGEYLKERYGTELSTPYGDLLHLEVCRRQT